jgi:uncharacterized protein YqeY
MNIKELRKTMMLAKKNDPAKAGVLSMLLDTAQKIAKADGNREAEEKDVLAAAKRELKMASQSKEAGLEIGDTIAILEEFLPQTMSPEETRAIVESIIAELPDRSPKAMGMVMGKLKKEFGDQLDMGIASRLVKEALAK